MISQRKVWLLGAITLSGTLALSGCGNSSTPTTTPTPSASVSETSVVSPSPTITATPTDNKRAMAQYWVGDTSRGFRLYREFVRIDPMPDAITAALRALVSHKPVDPDYVSLWPADTKINSVAVTGSSASIDLSFGRLNVGSEAEALAIAQIVWTATAANNSVKRISLTVDGRQVESLAGHVDATKPFTRALTYEVLAPVWITSPTEGEAVSAEGFTLRGLASTFEANVAWKVFKDGKLVQQGSTTAAESAPAWAPWHVAISGLAPGEYLFIALEYSAKDGSLVAQDSKVAILK